MTERRFNFGLQKHTLIARSMVDDILTSVLTIETSLPVECRAALPNQFEREVADVIAELGTRLRTKRKAA